MLTANGTGDLNSIENSGLSTRVGAPGRDRAVHPRQQPLHNIWGLTWARLPQLQILLLFASKAFNVRRTIYMEYNFLTSVQMFAQGNRELQYD